jgi:hypothetical protein
LYDLLEFDFLAVPVFGVFPDDREQTLSLTMLSLREGSDRIIEAPIIPCRKPARVLKNLGDHGSVSVRVAPELSLHYG